MNPEKNKKYPHRLLTVLYFSFSCVVKFNFRVKRLVFYCTLCVSKLQSSINMPSHAPPTALWDIKGIFT